MRIRAFNMLKKRFGEKMKFSHNVLIIFTLVYCCSIAFSQEYIPSRNLDPNYQPVTYADYQAIHPERETVVREISVSQTRDFSNFLIVVDSDLYPQVDQSILTYQQNLEQDEINAFILTFSGTRCSDLRNLLASYYQSYNIMGAMLVGDLPLAWYELFNDWNHSGVQDGAEDWTEFPMDIYYTDLDGEWFDTDANGIFDEHCGNIEPDIILGRIKADNLTLLQHTEAELVNSYFAKNNQFRLGNIIPTNSALLYLDDDWHNHGDDSTEDLMYSFEEVIFVNDSLTTCASDYAEKLTQNYDLIQVNVHSNPFYHQFFPEPNFTNVDLINTVPNALFYNLFACSNVNLAAPNNMGSIYLLDNEFSQAVLGSTKSGGILYTEEIYRPILHGERIGDNFREWWIAHVDTGTDTTWQRAWFYGLTFLGDPFLKLKENATFIGGEIEGTLSLDNSPYYVTDDLIVPAGSTLEIEAGCELIFMENDYLKIYGNIEALGTPESPILFHPLYPDEVWKGFYFESEDPNLLSRIESCIIQDCRKSSYAYSYGGGILVENSNVVILNSDFNNCRASNGGAIALINSNDISIVNCSFTENKASYGGALALLNSTSSINDLIINNNQASNGGGIYLDENSNLDVNNCSIYNNTSTSTNSYQGMGGGICSSGILTLSNTSIKNNSANHFGGGVCIFVGEDFIVNENVSIYNNVASFGADLANESENGSYSVVLDTFSVQYPTSYYAYPANGLEVDFQHFTQDQIDGEIYVSPSGDNSNSGASPRSPLKTIKAALFKSMPVSDETLQEIILAPGTYSEETTGEKFPIRISDNIALTGSGIEPSILYPSDEDINRTFDTNFISKFELNNITIKRDLNNQLGDPHNNTTADLMFNNCEVELNNTKLISSSANGMLIRCLNSELSLTNLMIEPAEDNSDVSSIIVIENSTINIESCFVQNMKTNETFLDITNSEVHINGLSFDNVARPLTLYQSEVDIDGIMIANGSYQGSSYYDTENLLSLNLSSGSIRNSRIISNSGDYNILNVTNATDSIFIENTEISYNYSEYGTIVNFSNSSNIALEGVTISNNICDHNPNIEIQYSNVIFSPTNLCNIYNNHYDGSPSEIVTNLYVNLILNKFTVLEPTASECAPLDLFDFNILSAADEEYINSDIYVSPDGNNLNSGLSPSEPMLSIHHAVNCMNPTEENPLTIHLASGIYDAFTTGFPIYGKSYLTIQGAGRDSTFISGNSRLIELEGVDEYKLLDLSLVNIEATDIFNSINSNFTIDNVNISECITHDPAFFLSNCTARFVDVVWKDNICTYYDELFRASGGELFFERCVIENTTLYSESIINVTNTIFSLDNCLFHNNDTDNEALIYSFGSTLDIANSIFMGLEGEYYYNGLIEASSTDISIRSSIALQCNNSFIDYHFQGQGYTCDIDYSLIEGGISSIDNYHATLIYGENNLDADPLFVDFENGDFLLQPDSPCIDAGDPDGGLDLEDPENPGFALWPSLGTTAPDMGIYGGYYAAYREREILSNEQPPELKKYVLTNHPNPFNPITEIRFKLSYFRSQKSEISEDAHIEIYNIKGQKVKSFLIPSSALSLINSVIWNGHDNQGNQVSSGVYLYSLKMGNKIRASRKMLLLK